MLNCHCNSRSGNGYKVAQPYYWLSLYHDRTHDLYCHRAALQDSLVGISRFRQRRMTRLILIRANHTRLALTLARHPKTGRLVRLKAWHAKARSANQRLFATENGITTVVCKTVGGRALVAANFFWNPQNGSRFSHLYIVPTSTV